MKKNRGAAADTLTSVLQLIPPPPRTVDAYDALTSHRAYRTAPFNHEAATPRSPAWEEISRPAPMLKLA